jgi:hypothetical protein
MTRGAAWLITGWTFFGFFFSRFGAFLFPMPTACHGFARMARSYLKNDQAITLDGLDMPTWAKALFTVL